MIIGIGCDVIELNRFATSLERVGSRFLLKLFTPKEIAYCQKFSNPLPHFAARFAAKEALSKALGVGIGAQLSWLDMEITNNENGQPLVTWHVDIQSRFHISRTHLTISHSTTVAMAQVLLEGFSPLS